MDSQSVHSNFVGKWVRSEVLSPTPALQLDAFEDQLGFDLPKSYKEFVSTFGTPSVKISLLHSIVEGEHHIPDLKEFLPLDQTIGQTEAYESGGMERGFFGFAHDCMGNLFLFKKDECKEDCLDAPVWFFDHDFVTIKRISDGFTPWIERYARVPLVES